MRLSNFLASARRAGLAVRPLLCGDRVEVGVFNGRVWTLGVQIITDGAGHFVSAHRIDVPLSYATNLRTVREVATIFSEVM
jgi:hypothetical protein